MNHENPVNFHPEWIRVRVDGALKRGRLGTGRRSGSASTGATCGRQPEVVHQAKKRAEAWGFYMIPSKMWSKSANHS